MYLVLVISTILIWYLLHYYKWKKEVYDYLAKLPGPFRVPFLGTLYMYIGVIREDLLDVMISCTKKYGPLFCVWSGWQPEIHVIKPEHVEIILNNTVHLTKGSQYDALHPYFGDGLVTTKGAKWHQHRKIITPTFHFKILKHFMEIFIDNSAKLLTLLDSKTDAGKMFDIHECIDLCALDIICESAMGVSINAMFDKDNKYIKNIKRMEELAWWRVMHPYVPDFLFNILPQGRMFNASLKVAKEYTEKVLRSRKNTLSRETSDSTKKVNEDDVFGRKKCRSFLDMLLESSEGGKVLSDKDIEEEVNTFLSAGYETVATTVSWNILLLGNYPEAQEKAFAEIREIIQDKLTPTSLTELSNLKYLDCVIKESLRLFPSIPFITRSLQRDVNIDGYKIPAGVEAYIEIYNMHRNAEYFPKPEKFDPSRFLPENAVGRHPYAYVPFSAGPRNCVGQKYAMFEAKTILASIINRYKITAVEAPENVKRVPEITLRPMNGIYIKLERRK